MKVSSPFALVTLAAVAVAQNTTNPTDECTACLQRQFQSAPGCANVNLTQDPDPQSYAEMAKCFCGNQDGAFMDPCKAETFCGQKLDDFKAVFRSNLEQIGLSCTGPSPTFSFPSPDAVAPSNTDAGIVAPTNAPDSASTRLFASMTMGLVAMVGGMVIQLL